MLTIQELKQAERALRATRVLSVYLDGTATDPAERTAWRRELDRMIDRARDALLLASHDEHLAFERCIGRLREALADRSGALGAPGWAGFFTAAGESQVGALPVEMPMLLAWENGMRIVPYLRALEQHRPVLVAIVDARTARLYRCAERRLAQLHLERAHADGEPPEHTGYPPKLGFHTGAPGSAGADASEAVLWSGTERMLREVVSRLELLASEDETILLGGIPEVAVALRSMLPVRLRGHTRRPRGLDVHATDAEIGEAVARSVAESSRERDLERIGDLLGQVGAGGRGTVGLEPVGEALHEHAVRRLYLTDTPMRRHPIETEAMVRAAFAEGAEIEMVTGDAAERLDERGGGVGALLRFVPLRAQARLPSAQHARTRIEP